MGANGQYKYVAHDPNNDICDSSPFESCICELDPAEQSRLIGTGLKEIRIKPGEYLEEWDEDLIVLDEQ